MTATALTALPILALCSGVTFNYILLTQAGGKFIALLSIEDHVLTALQLLPVFLALFIISIGIFIFINDRISADAKEELDKSGLIISKVFIVLGIISAPIIMAIGEEYDLQTNLYLFGSLAIAVLIAMAGAVHLLISQQQIKTYGVLIFSALTSIAMLFSALYATTSISSSIKKGSYDEYRDIFIFDKELSSLESVLDGVSTVKNFSNGSIVATNGGEIFFIPMEHILAIRHRASN